MVDSPLLIDIVDGCALLSMNRPESLNALSSELRRMLIDALASLDNNTDVQVAILTGVGRAFCAGIDLKEIGHSERDVNAHVSSENVVGAIERFTKPLIGAVNGLAVTGGFEISLACDILVAGRSARFADTHVRVGINPGWGLSQRLSRTIGIFRAKELSLTGNFLSAEQACEWGLVNRVVSDHELLDTARKLAADIAANDPVSVRRMKSVIDEGFGMPLGDALRMESDRAGILNSGVSAASVEGQRDIARGKARKSL